jgi:hypothetical protein
MVNVQSTADARQCRACGSMDIYVVDRLVPMVLGRESDDVRAGKRAQKGGKRGGSRIGARVDNGRSEIDFGARDAGIVLGVLRRRRECRGCGWRWNTFEVREADLAAVVALVAAAAAAAKAKGVA